MIKVSIRPLQNSKNRYERQKSYSLFHQSEIDKTPLSSYGVLVDEPDDDNESEDKIIPLSDLVITRRKSPSYFTAVVARYYHDIKTLYEYFEKKYCTHNYTLNDYWFFSEWLHTINDTRKLKNINMAYRSFHHFCIKVDKHMRKRNKVSSKMILTNKALFYKLMKERK